MSDVPQPPILDLARLEQSAGGDHDLMRQLAKLYIADVDAKLQGLGTAVAAGEATRSGDVAHGIKGASATIGAEEAREAFMLVERIGRSGETEGLEDALRNARDAYLRARAELRSLAA